MVRLILSRTENTEDGVFGRLYMPNAPSLFTMEEDWKQNKRGQSCIPAGIYALRRTIYYKHGYETFEVMNVPGRTRILIHPANTEEDVEGCIGVGLRRGTLVLPDEDSPTRARREKRAVLDSQEAFRRFMKQMIGVDTAALEIEWKL